MSAAIDQITRQHAESRETHTHELVDLDRYVVLLDGPVGYVDVVPPLFVCYAGHPYAVAVEIAQVHELGLAVHRVQEHAARGRVDRIAG